jgi:hypothetical protein
MAVVPRRSERCRNRSFAAVTLGQLQANAYGGQQRCRSIERREGAGQWLAGPGTKVSGTRTRSGRRLSVIRALESRRRTERSVDGATRPEAAEEGRTRAQRAAGRDDAPAPPAARATSIRSADREQLQEPLQPARA